jgi:perosamine synthetase
MQIEVKPRWKTNFDDRNPNEFLFPALNWHTNELSCAIGISSLKRLGDTIRKRQSFVSELFTLMSELDDSIFSIRSWSPSDSPFVVPIFVDHKKTKFTKIEIANFLKAEGIDLNPHYQYLVSDWHWVKPYLFDEFIPKQALENINNSFCLYLNENYSIKEAKDVLAAMMKVENYVLKNNKKKFFSIEKIN